ncbi:MAG: FapA family protein [Lachnospiraceae bacterium]|nr:FapA family protein [Lachnospiraceae bacterium]
MGDQNAYFRLRIKNDGTYLELIPPQGNGDAFSFGEMQEYLIRHGQVVDKVEVAKAIQSAEGGKCEIKLDSKPCHAVSESYELLVSDDRMRCTARFFPGSDGGMELKKEELINDLKFKKICYGIHDDAIDSFFKEKKYCTDYIIAEGEKPVEGCDGSIEYLFNTDPNTRPKLKEDGTVDFFNLEMISLCKAGDVVARLIPAQYGKNGKDVYGTEIPPREVYEPRFSYGLNLKVSDNGLELISGISGDVSLVDNKVFVSNVYHVNDVDTSTGNIEYDGDVNVAGNVKAGFSVKASGNVDVKGVVEGAYVEAGGDIIIARGMNGMGRGKLVAGRNVIAKFIENSTVEAVGYVHSEAILHSNIISKSDVVVTGKKGFITGGSIHALGDVEAKTIGSEMGVDTDIQVGADPTVKLKAAAMEQAIKENNKKLGQIKPVLATLMMRVKKGDKLTPDQQRNLRQMSDDYKQLSETVAKQMDEYEDYLSKMDDTDSESVIKVSGCAYPGTRITISEVFLQLKTPAQHSRFVKEGADVRIKAL